MSSLFFDWETLEGPVQAIDDSTQSSLGPNHFPVLVTRLLIRGVAVEYCQPLLPWTPTPTLEAGDQVSLVGWRCDGIFHAYFIACAARRLSASSDGPLWYFVTAFVLLFLSAVLIVDTPMPALAWLTTAAAGWFVFGGLNRAQGRKIFVELTRGSSFLKTGS